MASGENIPLEQSSALAVQLQPSADVHSKNFFFFALNLLHMEKRDAIHLPGNAIFLYIGIELFIVLTLHP